MNWESPGGGSGAFVFPGSHLLLLGRAAMGGEGGIVFTLFKAKCYSW